MLKVQNGAVSMDEILDSISTLEIDNVRRLNGISKASLKLAFSMLSDRGFHFTKSLKECFPSISKFESYKTWAENYGPGTLEMTREILNMVLGPCEEFKMWEEMLNQRVWVSYHRYLEGYPPDQIDLERHFVMVAHKSGMFSQMDAPRIGAPRDIWQKLIEV